MNSINSVDSRKYQGYISIPKIKSTETTTGDNSDVKNPSKPSKPSFTATTATQVANIRTELTTAQEKEKYNAIAAKLNKHDKKTLELLLKNGRLLNANSNDKSTTLDNLYKIITTPRAQGLAAENVLKETIATIANPFIITQQFGDVPKKYVNEVIKVGRQNISTQTNLIDKTKSDTTVDEINEKTIDVKHSGACVAASIEFNLAKQMPAEFARFAEGLSSPKVAVEKIIQTNNLASNTLDAIWLLNAFETPYKMDNFNSATLTLAPDKNAIISAQIQNSFKDPWERSLVDVLMQSTFMNVGSQQAYNSLTDVRKGKFNQNDRGLIEFEKTYTESIVEDRNKISMTYQIVDDNAKLVGYETNFNTIKKHILDSLAIGENVIIGYTQVDANNIIINGHEITIVAAQQDKNGKLVFICNDTDDGSSKPVAYSEDYLIPKIHHAGLPASVVENDVKVVDNWVEALSAYRLEKAKYSSN